MIEGLIEAVPNPSHVLPQLYDYSSDEDSRPLIIKRRVAPLPQKLNGKEDELGSLRKRQRCGVSSSEISQGPHTSLPKWVISDDEDEEKDHEYPDNATVLDDIGLEGPHTSRPEWIISDDEDEGEDLDQYTDDATLLDNIGSGVLCLGPKRSEMHQIGVDDKFCGKSDYVKLLKEINCEARFVACSVEAPCVFYAKLNHREADDLRCVDGILGVIPCYLILGHC